MCQWWLMFKFSGALASGRTKNDKNSSQLICMQKCFQVAAILCIHRCSVFLCLQMMKLLGFTNLVFACTCRWWDWPFSASLLGRTLATSSLWVPISRLALYQSGTFSSIRRLHDILNWNLGVKPRCQLVYVWMKRKLGTWGFLFLLHQSWTFLG